MAGFELPIRFDRWSVLGKLLVDAVIMVSLC